MISDSDFKFVSRRLPPHSTATLAALPSMSLIPFAPFRFPKTGKLHDLCDLGVETRVYRVAALRIAGRLFAEVIGRVDERSHVIV